jgi:hypothetical protein
MDLARELRHLDVDWPETPDFALELEQRRRRRWPLVLALAALVAVVAALAVPESRGSILRFLHLGAATIELVGTSPRAEQRPLDSGLGEPVTLHRAQQVIRRLLLPPGPLPRLHLAYGNAVSMVFIADDRAVLLSAFSDVGYFKKAAYGGTQIERVRVGNDSGVWLHGARHDVFFPNASPRLAGNTLIWLHDSTTYRLEAANLSRADALELALSLRPDTP